MDNIYRDLFIDIVKEQSHNRFISKVPKILHDFISSRGFEVKVFESNGIKNIYSIVGTPNIIFNAHWDTVELNKQQEFIENGDTISGLGTCDMKSGLVSAVRAYIELRGKGFSNIGICLVGDEEIGGENGTQKLVNDLKLFGKYAFICEPTDMKISLGQKSGLLFRLSYTGYTGHGAYPHRGINAIHHYSKFVIELLEYFKQDQIKTDDDAFDNITITPSFLTIGNKNALNIVPGNIEAALDVRFPPNIDYQQVVDMVEIIAKRYSIEVNFQYLGKGWRLDKKSDMYKILSESYRSVLKSEPVYVKKMGTNDGKYYAEKGSQVVNVGPGDNKLSHTGNEFVKYEDIIKCSDIYIKTVESLLS